jgi:hypothetical protein
LQAPFDIEFCLCFEFGLAPWAIAADLAETTSGAEEISRYLSDNCSGYRLITAT